ncbi:hypothetical protein BDZ89DRAFT_1079433 [Hymenopellis radicata]|nr:hypothetical protein BDZ89DRAFT_1079433 [Hymenopellis radicata]
MGRLSAAIFRSTVSMHTSELGPRHYLKAGRDRPLLQPTPLMAAFLKRLVLTTTVYPDVQRALQDLQHVPHSDDIVPTLAVAVVRCNISVSITGSQIPSTSGQPRTSTLPKDVILPELKDHFLKLLAQHDIPIQYTNLGAPQLPWCTLPELLRNRRLEIVGWPEDLPLPDATGKHNAKGIMGLTAKEARRLYEALPGISFCRMDKARARPREEESEDNIGNRPTKKVKGKGKAPEEGEKKFRLSEVQKVIHGIHVGKSN